MAWPASDSYYSNDSHGLGDIIVELGDDIIVELGDDIIVELVDKIMVAFDGDIMVKSSST